MHVLRYLPASIRRAFSLMWFRVRDTFADTPYVFFAVVIGVALLFKVSIGAIRDASIAPEVAPTFVPEPGLPTASETPSSTSASSTSATPPIGEVGAAAKVQPIGAPARVSPKPRGHGRRLPH